MSQEWRSWLLFVNGADWGSSDAQFGTDLGFYVFKLPFLSSVADWAFASVLIVLVVTVAAHFANGGIRVQPAGVGTVGPRVTSQVKAHISVLLGAARPRPGRRLLPRAVRAHHVDPRLRRRRRLHRRQRAAPGAQPADADLGGVVRCCSS